MLRSRCSLSPRKLLVLGFALCTLPGCGSGSSYPFSLSTVARSITLTFYGHDLADDPYLLSAPIDTNKPYTITKDGTPLVLNADYTIDSTFPNVIRIHQAVPGTMQIIVQYTTLATISDEFPINSSNVTRFTLSHPADTSRPFLVTWVGRILANNGGPVADGVPFNSDTPLSAQDYTIDPKNSAIIRLTKTLTPPATLTVTYVTKTQ